MNNEVKNDDEFMLTTKDNPFNPFTQYDEWYEFDHEKGYCCCEYLARLCDVFGETPEDMADKVMEQAINDILRIDPDKSYTRIYRNGRLDDSIDPDLVPSFPFIES